MCAEGGCSKRSFAVIQEGWHIFCYMQVGHKTTPANTLLYWGHSKSYFKTPSFFTRVQKNLHEFHEGMRVFFHSHFLLFKYSPGRLAPGLSCAMDFHCHFGEVTKSNRLSVLPLMTTFQLIAIGIGFQPQPHWVLNIPRRTWKIYFLLLLFPLQLKPSCISFSFSIPHPSLL